MCPHPTCVLAGRIEHTDEQKQKKIAGWISSINDIHKSKPAATVSYARRMPDIEALMQEWPPEMETFIRNMQLPTGDIVSEALSGLQTHTHTQIDTDRHMCALLRYEELYAYATCSCLQGIS